MWLCLLIAEPSKEAIQQPLMESIPSTLMGQGGLEALSVYCDHTSDSGGWLRAARISRSAEVWDAFLQGLNAERAGENVGDFGIPFTHFSTDADVETWSFFSRWMGSRKERSIRKTFIAKLGIRQSMDVRTTGRTSTTNYRVKGATWTECQGNNYHMHSDWNWSIGRQASEGMRVEVCT